jgi:phosphoribosylformylglycinamidine synthase
VISLKAETPNNCRAFQRSSNGFRREIRDRLAGGQGSCLAGTAVYMTSYSRLEENRPWENMAKENGCINSNGYFNQSFKRSI